MIGRAILVAFTFVIAIIIFTFTLPSVLSESDNARYTSTTTPLNCTTDVNGVCLLTLPSKHANSTTEGIDVSDANTSASYTSDTSISADQSVLSVSNLPVAVSNFSIYLSISVNKSGCSPIATGFLKYTSSIARHSDISALYLSILACNNLL